MARKDLLSALEKQLETSQAEGGKLLYGGKRITVRKYEEGNFIVPAVLEVNTKNIANREELFGPVFALFKVKDEQEAITIANGSEYGLGATIISRDIEHAE